MAFLNPFQPPLPTGRQAQTMKIPLDPPFSKGDMTPRFGKAWLRRSGFTQAGKRERGRAVQFFNKPHWIKTLRIFVRSSFDIGGRKGRAAALSISPIMTKASLIRVCQYSLGWE